MINQKLTQNVIANIKSLLEIYPNKKFILKLYSTAIMRNVLSWYIFLINMSYIINDQ